MKMKYEELREELSEVIPDWQKSLVREEIEAIQNGTATLMDWDEVKKSIKINRP